MNFYRGIFLFEIDRTDTGLVNEFPHLI
jgi:hypothetical protein